jgi:hypothetical protein
MGKCKLLTNLQLKEFIKKNSYFIYEYINSDVLKDIGMMNPEYFIKVIQDIFIKEIKIKKNLNNVNSNIFPYFLFTLLSKNGKIDYTSLRVETINFNQINKESSTYYNYVRFSLRDNLFIIELIQSKIGGMPIDKDIVKFKKEILIKSSGLQEFIIKKEKDISSISSNNQYKKIKENIANIMAIAT